MKVGELSKFQWYMNTPKKSIISAAAEFCMVFFLYILVTAISATVSFLIITNKWRLPIRILFELDNQCEKFLTWC